MEETKGTVTLYAEMTPNPLTMKFVANKYLLIDNATAEFTSIASTKGYSPLAEALFQFPFVDGVFISGNFITVTKTNNVDWDFIMMELRDFIKEWIAEGKDIVLVVPSITAKSEEEQAVRKSFEPSVYDETILDLLDQYVRPAVESDGGAIEYVGYEEGVVTVELKGSCSGCPSSTATLKGGIEQLLKENIETVTEVVALSV
jgi:Fe-S cluster biogenesis protein NfuA